LIGVYLDVGLRDDGRKGLALRLNGEALETVGRLGKEDPMEPQTDEVVAERAFVDALLEAFEPPSALFVVINLMLRTAETTLGLPAGSEGGIIEGRGVRLGPKAKMAPRLLIVRAQPRQFDD